MVQTIRDQIPRKKQPWDLMVIPFAKEAPRQVSKDERLSFKIYSTPTDPTSITFELQTYTFGEGSNEEWLEHTKTFDKLVAGTNITQGPPAFALLKLLLKGKALTDYEKILAEEGTPIR